LGKSERELQRQSKRAQILGKIGSDFLWEFSQKFLPSWRFFRSLLVELMDFSVPIYGYAYSKKLQTAVGNGFSFNSARFYFALEPCSKIFWEKSKIFWKKIPIFVSYIIDASLAGVKS
jgi:hypothetical protein